LPVSAIARSVALARCSRLFSPANSIGRLISMIGSPFVFGAEKSSIAAPGADPAW
jgi:hypothetical protein